MEAELAVVRRAEAQVEDAREHEHPHHVKQQEDPYVAHDALEHHHERREPLVELPHEPEQVEPEEDPRHGGEVDAVERVILLRRRDTAAHEARARQWRRMNIRKEFYPWPGMMSFRSVSS